MKKDRAKTELLRRIRDGQYQPGGKLPSERQLAVDLAVSHMTVREGLAELVMEGVVEKRPRVGNFLKPPQNHIVTRTVALLLPGYMLGEDRQHPGTVQLLRGIREELPSDDYEITFMAYEHMQLNDSIDRLVARGVDGVLYWPSPENPRPQVERLLNSGFPVVMLNRGGLWPDLPAHTVSIDVHRLIEDAWKRINALGHRDVASIRYDVDRWSAHEETCAASFEAQGDGRVARSVYVRDGVDPRDFVEDVSQLFNLDPLPSAVIVWDEFLAINLMNDCQRRGVRIPEDLSVVAIFNQTPHIFQPPLSSPNSCSLVSRLASEACRMIREWTDQPSVQPVTVSLVGEYQWTGSVRAV